MKLSAFPNRLKSLLICYFLYFFLISGANPVKALDDTSNFSYEIGLLKEGFSIQGDSLIDEQGKRCSIRDHRSGSCLHSKKFLKKEDLENFKPGPALIALFMLIVLLLILFLIVRKKTRLKTRIRKHSR